MHKILSLVKAVTLLGLCGFALRGGESASYAQTSAANLKSRILREYPPALERIEEFYSLVRGAGTEEEKQYYFDKPTPKGSEPINKIGVGGLDLPMAVTRKSAFEFAHSGPLAFVRTRRLFSGRFTVNADGSNTLIELKDPNSIPQERVYCVGDHGAFNISYTPGSKQPIVRAVGNDDSVKSFVSGAIDSSLFAASRVFDHRLLDCVRDRGFAIQSAEEFEENGRKLIAIEFSVKRPGPKGFPWPGGKLVVSPSEGWVLRHCVISGVKLPKAVTVDVEYQESTDPGTIPLPKRVIRRDQFRVWTTEFVPLVHEVVPASQFTLSAFGLPDINKPIAEHVPGQAARWYYWAAGVALVVAVGLKVYLGYASKRQARPA